MRTEPASPEATLTTISSNGTRQSYAARFCGLSNGFLTLGSEAAVSISQAVTVEYEDVLFLGEVVRCVGGDDGCRQIDVLLTDTLTGLQSLIRMRAALLGTDKDSLLRDELPVDVIAA